MKIQMKKKEGVLLNFQLRTLKCKFKCNKNVILKSKRKLLEIYQWDLFNFEIEKKQFTLLTSFWVSN